MENTFFYFLKRQPTLILRDLITSIQVTNSKNVGSKIKIIFIPTSPIEFIFKNKATKTISELLNNKKKGNACFEIIIENVILEIQIFQVSKLTYVKFLLNSINASLYKCIKYFLLQFNIFNFLKSKYKEIQYGDIAASTVFRNKNMFELSRDFELIKETFRLTLLIQILENIGFKQKNKNNYFSVLDFTYSEALLLRVLPIYNFKYIETQDYRYENLIINKPDLYYYPWIARDEHNEINIDIFNNYYNSRLYNPHEVLDYMWMGTNNNNNHEVFLDNGTPLINNENEQYVVVFLHAFSDAAFCYGLDGYKDLMDWTLCTINLLLLNNSIDKILIKPHPNISFDYYPADQTAMTYLKSYFLDKTKVQFLEKKCSLIALCEFNNIIGITRHGSVAEEMTFLNKPVVAYRYGPWKNYHDFLITWDSKKSYEEILSNLDYNKFCNIPNEHKKYLANYCFEYRIDSRKVSRGWYDVLNILNTDSEFVGNFDNINKLDFIIKSMKIQGALEYLFKNNAINLN